MTIEEFVEKCLQRPLPNTPMERARILAREIVEGAYHELWRRDFQVQDSRVNGTTPGGLWFLAPTDGQFNALHFYLNTRWRDGYPSIDLLIGTGYFDITFERTVHPFGNLPSHVRLSVKSTELLNEASATNIFISYSRNDSSSFALYVLEKLKQAGLDAFLDIDLKAGDEWHGRLQKQIEEVDTFVVIIGANTLKSEYVQKEIHWAKGKTIYPIWEASFVKKQKKWQGVREDIAAIIQSTQAIEIPKQHPQHYLTAITQLLNRFGITP